MRALLLCFLFACSLPSTPTPAANQPTQLTITAKEMIAAYDANEVSADQTYKGKIVEVSGTVSSISKDILYEPFITLAGKSSTFREVQCPLPEAQAATLKKNQKIVLKGRVTGRLMNVQLEGCSIVP